MNSISKILSNIYSNKKLLTWCLFSGSIIVSLLFLFLLGGMGPSQHQELNTDYVNCYEPFADSILRGEGIFVKDNSEICSPPGYPLILAVIFSLAGAIGVSELSLIFAFNIIVVAGTVCLLFFIVEALFNRKIALIASFLWMSYPFNLWFLKNPHTEVPFIFLLCLGIWLYLSSLRKKNIVFFLATGVIIGLCILIRPVALLLFLVFLLFIFFLNREKFRVKLLLSVIFLLGVVICISPWEIGVFLKTGQVVPITTGAPTTTSEGLVYALRTGSAGDRVSVPDDVFALMERAEAEDLTSEFKVLRFAKKELVNEPVAFLKLIGLKMARSWYATSQMWWENKILIVQSFYLFTGLFGLIYAIKSDKKRIREIIFLLSIVLYFWGMTVAVLSILRYMVPVMAIVIIFSAITISLLMDRIFKKA